MKAAMANSPEPLAPALMPKPLNERVWRWLKDHPDKSSAEIARALGERLNSVSAVLSNMIQRKMIGRKEVPNPRAKTGARTVLVYTVSIREYELLHLSKSKVKGVQKSGPKPATASSPTNVAALLPTAEQPTGDTIAPTVIPKVLAKLTLAECQEVYLYLDRMFGRRA